MSPGAGKGKGKPLVPITREFLKNFYANYPLDPVPTEVADHMQRVEDLIASVTKPGSKVPEQFGMETPKRIDDCFWRNRMICEELALSFSRLKPHMGHEEQLSKACDRMHGRLVQAERDILTVQESNTASVKGQLQQFIPQDFRGAILESKRVSTEAKYKKQVDDLVKKGGSIRAKYELYLQQQWERRQALVQLGECSGMYKMVIKWVAGIPQVLLDFAKEINAKLGPMEEQRITYGPDLYAATALGLRLDVLAAAWAEAGPAAGQHAAKLLSVVEPAVAFYCTHMLRVVQHIGNVFQHSPFFVNKEDLAEGAGAAAAAAAVASPLPTAVSVPVSLTQMAHVTQIAEAGKGAPTRHEVQLIANGAASMPIVGGGAGSAALAPLGGSGVVVPATPESSVVPMRPCASIQGSAAEQEAALQSGASPPVTTELAADRSAPIPTILGAGAPPALTAGHGSLVPGAFRTSNSGAPPAASPHHPPASHPHHNHNHNDHGAPHNLLHNGIALLGGLCGGGLAHGHGMSRRCSLAGDSVCSFCSADEQQPWHSEQEQQGHEEDLQLARPPTGAAAVAIGARWAGC